MWRDLGRFDRKVRFDYRDFIREQNAEVFFGRSRQWCRDHGVRLIGHVIEDHQQDMRRLEFLDIPGFDQIMGHWYAPNPDVYWRQSKMASSVAHYAGSRNDVALAEHFALTTMPTSILFNRDGQPVYRHGGFHPEKTEEYEQHIVALLVGEDVPGPLAMDSSAGPKLGVSPWERGCLARPEMALDSDPLEIAFDDHVYFSREASSGGRGFGGGGCGCN